MASTTKWHINDKGEVHPCKARLGNCRFGGQTGDKNHFSSREGAELYLAKGNSGFSELGTKRKRVTVEIGAVKPETKAAVETLLDRGLAVSATSSLEGLTSATPSRSSEVDILEDDLEGISLESIKARRPF